MPNVKANGIQIEYDTFGDSSASPLLLVMGLGAQMTRWEEEFCNKIADKGHYVIRYDNRDVGLSTKFDEASVTDVLGTMAAIFRKEKVEVTYTLDDMADDGIGLMDVLGIEKAHICGASMGGFIVQTMGVRHPSRISSITSIMSGTGNPNLPQAKPKAMNFLLQPAPTERDKYIDYMVKGRRIIGSPGFAFDEERIRENTALDFDRSFYPEGAARQLIAILIRGNRKEALASIKVPTLIIHGADDPLVPVEHGKDTAEAIPGSELMIIDGMGHDIPREVWPQLIDAIASNAAKAMN